MMPSSFTNPGPGAAPAAAFASALARALAPATSPEARAAAVRSLLDDHPPPPDVAGLDAGEPRTAELALARTLSRLPMGDAGPVAGRLIRAVLFLPLTAGERLHAVRLLLRDLETFAEARR